MIILLGVSLFMYGSGTWLAELGRFSIYFTSIFLILFITLFLIPMRINIDLPYYYGQYAVTMPVVFLLNSIGLNVRIPEDRLIEVLGNYHALLKIDLACFGWYSILLIVSMLVAYNLTIERRSWSKIVKIMLVLVGASYLANLLRVSALVVLTYYYGVERMLSIHSHLGWILFVIILLPITYIFMKNSSPQKA
jgi:archaeosortase C (PEF-CTERM variant)